MAAGETAGAVLLCDKPAGMTSHDVVARVRRERGCRVGHAGTLDPFATGLLVLLLGRATKLQRHLIGLPKTYLATARLGWRSSTGDPDGELTETGRLPESLQLPTGTVRQRVPMTSAVRVGGSGSTGRRTAARRSRRRCAMSRSIEPSCSAMTPVARPMRSSAQPGPTFEPCSRRWRTPSAPRCVAPRSAPSRSRTPVRSWDWTASPSWSPRPVLR